LQGLLEVTSLKVATETVRAGTHSKSWSWRERIPDFRGCNAKAAGAKWSADKRNR